MNYRKIYESLIDKGRNRSVDTYTESHHIIPRCIGGVDTEDNLVDLTPEEHFVAHQLLIKIYPNEPKIILAARYMTNGNKKNGGRTNNKMYGWLKRKHSQAMRDINLGKKQSPDTIEKRASTLRGRINGPLSEESIRKRTETRKLRNSGSKRQPRSDETKKKLSDANKGNIPKNKGTHHSDEDRQKIKDALAKLPPYICPHCGKEGKSTVMFRWHFDKCTLIRRY